MPLLKIFTSSTKNVHIQSLFGNGVMALLGMATVAILYRALSVHDIGVYVFFMTILNLVDTLKSGFLTNAFIKFYSGTEEKRAAEVIGSTWCMSILISIILIIVNLFTFLIFKNVNNPGLSLFLKYFSLVALSSVPAFMANIVVQGDKRFDRLLWIRLISQLLFTGSIVLLILLKKATLNTTILAYGFSNLLAGVTILILGWAKIRLVKYFTIKAFKEIFHFGKYSFGTNLSSNLYGIIDTVFINFFLGPSALAVYNLCGKLLQIVEIPLLSLATSIMPGLASDFNNDRKEEMIYLMKKMTGMLSLAIICIAIFCLIFAEPIIMFIGGIKYLSTDAPNLFRIIIVMTITYPAERFFALALDIINKPKINFYKVLVMLGVNIIADFIGLKISLSIYVIVIANIFPAIIAIIMTYIPLNKYFKFNFWNVYKVGYIEGLLLFKHFFKNFINKEPLIKKY